jgi:hypothetical protein
MAVHVARGTENHDLVTHLSSLEFPLVRLSPSTASIIGGSRELVHCWRSSGLDMRFDGMKYEVEVRKQLAA